LKARTCMVMILFILMAVVSGADDLNSMSAVALNTKGYNLYEEKKYEESLPYFEASFAKDPDYAYQHYNYACVLSLLQRDRDAIIEHLLWSFALRPEYRRKYCTDPDLEWFRHNARSEKKFAGLRGYFNLGLYLTPENWNSAQSNIDTTLFKYNVWYAQTGNSLPNIDFFLEFLANGKVRAFVRNNTPFIYGTYHIIRRFL
jgi:tetratricopeptide (TPR) repeat protein